ncbi:hypothetical protein HELRODRAFT_164961 [Helobdella robusta]|uniref:Uncharacterized protein n=1 Tax=Helobdella robusta TaxID=6412 RepID=T1EW06_HELRO|nr:hypothetical protein HELRODRAFT_164961 [Helobdella robusta]ESN92830.1 hypothetical protein HELRODRAFT_164961 [Helobdella robusta]
MSCLNNDRRSLVLLLKETRFFTVIITKSLSIGNENNGVVDDSTSFIVFWPKVDAVRSYIINSSHSVKLPEMNNSNGGISSLLKVQRNRQIFTVNLEQEIAKGIGREKLLKARRQKFRAPRLDCDGPPDDRGR